MSSNPYLDALQEQTATPSAPPAPPVNPYLDALRADQDERTQQQRLKATAMQTVGSNADEYAKQRRTAEYLGYPIAAVQALPKDMQQRADMQRLQENVAGQPVLQRKYTDEDFARLAHDDHGVLSAIGSGIRYLVSRDDDRGLVNDIAAGYHSASSGIAGLERAVVETAAYPFDFLERFPSIGGNPLRRLGEGFGSISQDQKLRADAAGSKFDGIVGKGVASGVQSLTGNAIALPVALVNPAAGMTVMAGQQGGSSYQAAREKGVGQLQSLAYGASDAAIEYATEKLPLGALLHGVKEGAPIWKTLLKTTAAEIPGEQLATVLQDLNEWAVLHPEKPFSDYLAERPSAAAQTLIATVIGAGGNVAIATAVQRTVDNATGVDRAQTYADGLQRLVELANDSKLRERSPETFASVVQDMVEQKGAPSELFLSAESLAQSGVDPIKLAEAIPSARAQIEEAQLTGGDIVIPVGELMAATDFAQQLLPHLRSDPEAFTQTEAQAFNEDDALKAELDALIGPAETALAPDVSAQALDIVHQGISEQLASAGRFTPEVNKQYAQLITSFVAATAERAGLPVQQLWEQFAPRVVSEFSQAESPSLDAGVPGVEQGEALGQGKTQPRALYNPTNRTIALLERADLSSFLHESGHWFLEVMTDLASREGTSEQVKADMQTTMDWLGVADVAAWRAMTLDEQRDSHEKWARGVEAYLMEGQAPSEELQGVFSRFRAWLLNVYQHIKALNVELTPEVRQVFDRMLATDVQIQRTEQARSFDALFKTAEQAGMSPEDFAAYQAAGIEATTRAVEDLQGRSLRDMRALTGARSRALSALQRQASEQRKVIEAEVRKEVEAVPLYRAERLLRTGKIDDETVHAKLSRPALIEQYGDDESAPWRRLPDHWLTNSPETGITPDMLADAVGATSGDQLVQQLTTFDRAEVVIEGETDQRMLQRHGELVDEKSIQRAADLAVHNEARLRALQREHTALAKATGSTPVVQRAARMFAERTLAEKPIREIRPAMHTAAASRAGRAAAEAFRKGDTTAAAVNKRAQVLQATLARTASRAVDEVAATVDYLRKFDSDGTRKAIGPEYADQIDALLERYDLRKSITGRELARRKSLGDWVEAQRELGFDPIIDERLLADTQLKHLREMTLEELRGVRDAVKNIEHLGRLKQRLLTVQDQRAFDAIVSDASESIRANATKTIEQTIETQLPHDRAGKLLDQFLIGHRKLSSLIRQMDGGQDGGVMWSTLVQGMNRAGDNEAVMRAEATKELTKLLAPLNAAGDLFQKTYIPAIRGSLTKAGRLSVALNWGTESNRQRVMDGDRWSQDQVQAILDTLTQEDWATVQKLWAYIGSYWPQISAKEQRVSGVAPEKVDGLTVHTKFGDIQGAYYPIAYDPDRSSRAQADSVAELTKQAMQGAYTRATTRRGHTKARVDVVNRPVRKDLGVIFQHVGQVTHDLAWHEWLIDATRLLRAKPIEAAIRDHYGPEVLRTLSAAVQDIAAGDVPAQNAFEQAINHLRAGVSVASMGWSLVSAFQQPLGLSQSMVRIGPKWVGKGIARWLGDASRMESTVGWINERSDFMRLRAQTQNREIAEIQNRVHDSGGRSPLNPLPQSVRDTFFVLMSKMQLVSDVPTWLGQYTKSIEGGESEERAVALADQAVIDSQSSGQVKDLAAFQRGGPLQKLFTSFYSAFSATYNLSAESIARTDFKKPGDVGRLMVDFLLLYTLPAVLGMLLKDAMRGDDEDEDELAAKLAREQVTYIMSTMLGVRELSAMVSGTFGYSGPAGTRFFSEMAKLGKQVQQGEADSALFKAANSAAGALFHYPALQVERTVAGIDDYLNGNGTVRGIFFGPPPKK